MQSFQFIKELKEIKSVIDENHEFLLMLEDVYKIFETSLVHINELISVNGTNAAANHANELHGLIPGNLNGILINPKKIYTSLGSIHNAFERFISHNGEHNRFSSVLEIIDAAEKSFDNYFHRKNRNDSVELIISLVKLRSCIDGFENILSVSLHYLDKFDNNASSESFTIYLHGEVGLSEFGNKIEAIDEIFKFCIYILGISFDDANIQINKIESGSLFAKLTADPKVIALATSLISSAATYTFNNYTTEGKLEGFPEKVSSIEQVLSLRDKLSQAGIDVEAMDKEIENSSVKLARALNVLIENQYEFEINEERFSVSADKKEKLLELKSPKLLENSGE
jgi:hypothetical protein